MPPPSRGFLPLISNDGTFDCLRIGAACSFELFWDGRRLLTSGAVGRTRDEEVPGPLKNLVPLTRDMTMAGEHVVALRISSWHNNFPEPETGVTLVFATLREMVSKDTHLMAYPLVSMGGAMLVAVLSLVLYAMGDRWRPLLLCGAVSAVLALFYFLIARRWIYDEPYPALAPRLVAITTVMTVVAWLFPWLLLEKFAMSRKLRWLAAMTPFLLAAWWSSGLDQIRVLWLARVMFATLLLIAGWAAWRKRPDAWIVFITVSAGLLVVRPHIHTFLEPPFFVVCTVLVVLVFATLGAQVRAERRQAAEARLSAARLEVELLKKNLQPHFLFNTLATLVEVIEEDPKTAVGLVESLASEFRLFARAAGEKLIPLGHEIELCRAHLRIMSIRKATPCALDVGSGVDESALVPPALFHTLIENGLTHLRPGGSAQHFELTARHGPGRVCYTLLAHGRPWDDTPALNGSAAMKAGSAGPGPAAPREGTGLRYIKARLEESFPGRWRLRSEAVPEGWRTVIELDAPAPLERGMKGGFA